METVALTERQQAERAVNAAQAEVTAAQASVTELKSKLDAERGFRANLEQQYDSAAVDGREQDAQAFRGELSNSDIRIRGLELRLSRAQQELQERRAAEQRVTEELTRLAHAEAVEAEGVELGRMIEATVSTGLKWRHFQRFGGSHSAEEFTFERTNPRAGEFSHT